MMLDSIEVRDFMSKDPLKFTTETSIMDALHQILVRKVSGATVVDDDDRVVGVISEIDLLNSLEQISYYQQGDAKIGDLMSTSVDVMQLDTNIFQAAQTLCELKRRRMPVVHEGRFVGQISCRSVLHAFKDSMLAHDKSED